MQSTTGLDQNEFEAPLELEGQEFLSHFPQKVLSEYISLL